MCFFFFFFGYIPRSGIAGSYESSVFLNYLRNLHYQVCVCVCVYSCSVMYDSVIPWTVSRQVPLSMGFPKQENQSGLPFPSLGDLPDPEIEPTSLVSPNCKQILYHCTTWEASIGSVGKANLQGYSLFNNSCLGQFFSFTKILAQKITVKCYHC